MNKLSSLRKNIRQSLAGDSLSTYQRKVAERFLSLDDATIRTGCCTQCAASALVHKHSLMTPLLGSLYTIHKVRGTEPFRLSKELKGRSGLDNFQKLRYLGLIQKKIPKNTKDPKDKDRWSSSNKTCKSGIWRLTKLADKFLRGKATISAYAVTFRGDTIYRSKKQVTVKSRFGPWKKQKDYAKDSQLFESYVRRICDA